MAGIYPTVGKEDVCGNLRLLHSKFGSGRLLSGTHKLISPKPVQINAVAYKLTHATITPIITDQASLSTTLQLNHVTTIPKEGKVKVDLTGENLPSFFEAEDLGTFSPCRCDGCLKCKKCTERAQDMTRREACELKLLKDGMKLEGGQIKATYPFIKQGNLSDNQGQFKSMKSSLEKRLMKTDKIELYNSCFQDFIDQGVLR